MWSLVSSNERIYTVEFNFLLKILPVWKLYEDDLCSSVKTRTFELLKKLPHCLSQTIFDRKTVFSHVIRFSWNRCSKIHGKTRWRFFPSDKKFESPYFTGNKWENTRIISSTWIKEGCKEVIYYQTTQVTHWNLLTITTVNAIMPTLLLHYIKLFIFLLIVGRKKAFPFTEETLISLMA